MKLSREIMRLLLNTVLVTAAVVGGFIFGSALGLPVWLQGFCLLPAAWLFFRLSGETPPARWRVLGFFVLVSLYSLAAGLIFPHVPERFHGVVFFLLIVLMPTPSTLSRAIQRRWGEPGPPRRRRS